MVTDQQVRRLFMLIHQEPTLAMAAAKAGMDEKTARKYRRLGIAYGTAWRYVNVLERPRTL